MTDALVECVRLRGPHAARLARIAATALPDALDRSLSGLPSVRVGELTVRLDIDIAASDDATIATLWADAVRAQVLARVPESDRHENKAESRDENSAARRFSLADALAAARAWLSSAHPRGPLPRAALQLANMALDAPPGELAAKATRVIIELDAEISRELSAVRSARSGLDSRDGSPPALLDERSATELSAPPTSPRAEHSQEDPATRPRREHPSPAHSASAAVEPAAMRVAALAELASTPGEATQAIDVADITGAAGLALLYPWLADYCRSAVAMHPGRDEAEVRTHALAMLVNPDDPELLADPLIAVLAGQSESAPSPLARLAFAEEVEAEAGRVLTGFAALLPGFTASSPAFVRREWIQRAGLIDDQLDPVRLTAATHPLDVMIARLPYPVSLFKLPWSPPVMVRFRP